jgi:hypothetical protein
MPDQAGVTMVGYFIDGNYREKKKDMLPKPSNV